MFVSTYLILCAMRFVFRYVSCIWLAQNISLIQFDCMSDMSVGRIHKWCWKRPMFLLCTTSVYLNDKWPFDVNAWKQLGFYFVACAYSHIIQIAFHNSVYFVFESVQFGEENLWRARQCMRQPSDMCHLVGQINKWIEDSLTRSIWLPIPAMYNGYVDWLSSNG